MQRTAAEPTSPPSTPANTPTGPPVPAGTSAFGAAYTPDGRCFYVANQGAGAVTVIDTVLTPDVTTIGVDGGPNELAVSPNGQTVYVATESGKLDVIDTATNTVVSTPACRQRALAAAASPDGRFVYVTDNGAGRCMS